MRSAPRFLIAILLCVAALVQPGSADPAQRYAEPDGNFNEGMTDWAIESCDDAFHDLAPLAQHGDVAGQYYIGLMYRGLGVARDDVQAAFPSILLEHRMSNNPFEPPNSNVGVASTEIPYLKGWAMFFLVSTLSGFVAGALMGAVVGGALGAAHASHGTIVLTTGSLGFLISIPVSYFTFKWAVEKYFVNPLLAGC